MTTRIDEIADGIYRIATPIEIPGAGRQRRGWLILRRQPDAWRSQPVRRSGNYPQVA